MIKVIKGVFKVFGTVIGMKGVAFKIRRGINQEFKSLLFYMNLGWVIPLGLRCQT